MKRFSGLYILAVVLFPFILPLSVSAQSLKTFDRQVCQGASIFLDGGLYQILTNDCEILSIKADGTGEDLKGKERIDLTVTATYHITYRDNANPSGTVAYARITVMDPPVLKVELTDPRPAPASFCKGTSVTLRATRSNGDVYWTISSDENYSEKGTTVTFSLKENCRITAQSYNTCGFVDTSIYFPVITEPDLSNARLELNTELDGTFCIGCGFFPKTADILKGATQGVVTQSSLTWEDGSTGEEPVLIGSFSKRLKVHAVIEQQGAGCGTATTATRTIDSVITLTVSGGKDCQPTMQASVSLKPCRDGEVQLKDMYAACTVSNPTLTPIQPSKVSVTPVSGRFPYVEEDKKIYFWHVNWANYTKTDPAQTLKVQASYTVDCPYSGTKPRLTGTFEQTLNVQIDTDYIAFQYDYCPDGKATLEIKGQKDIVTIKSVALIDPQAGFSSMFSERAKENHQWTFESVDAITTPLLEKYGDLRLKVVFEVRDGNCVFSSEKEEDIHLRQKNNCVMDLVMEQTGPCIGEIRTLRLANAEDAVPDRIEVDPHPGFVFKQNPAQFTFEPYYAGAPDVPSKTDTIIATMYYHMQGSAQILSMSKKIELQVKACPPYFTGDVIINNDKNCPLCPGVTVYGTIEFENSTTAQERSEVEFITQAKVRKDQIRDVWRPRSPRQDYLQYQLWRYMFEGADFRVAVRYNEGDSLYEVPSLRKKRDGNDFGINNRGLTGYGETATPTEVGMADICGLVKEAEADSVCSGETVQFYVYSRNFFDTLASIQWDSASVRAVGTGKEEFTYEYGGTQQKKMNRFHYETSARGDGIYPFLIRTRIRDTVIERRDTLRVAVLKNPRIFIRDTVYACLNARLDLWKYVDSASVDVATLKCTAPDGLLIEHATDDYRVATADLRYHCSQRSLTERITVRVDPSVYNAFIEDTAHCPGEQVALNAKTNGRVTWTRRRLLPGGGFSQADTLFADVKNEVLSDVMGTSDQLYTVTAKTGCDQPPFQTIQFFSYAKKVPEVSVIDRSACRPEPLFLETKPLDAGEVDSAKDVRWYVDGQLYSAPSVPPAASVQVVCVVKGLNGCQGADTLEMRSYEAPDLKVDAGMPALEGSTLCVSQGDQVSFTATGADAYDWFVVSRNSSVSIADRYTLRVDRDDTVYVTGTESRLGCASKDTVYIYLKPLSQVPSDTIGCNGDTLEIRPVVAGDVSYTWYMPDGGELCSCTSILFSPYEPSDTGVYKIKFTRKGCDVTKDIHFMMYPVPDFVFTDSVFCEDDLLSLDVQTGMDAQWNASSRFVWYGKDGNPLQDKEGQSAYEGTALTLSDTGIYRIEIYVGRCLNTDSVQVVVDMHSHPAFAVDSFYCEGATLVTQAVDQGEGSVYRWFSKNRLPSEGVSNKIELEGLTIEDSTWLTLEIDRGACTDDTSVFVHVRSMPAPSIVAQNAGTDAEGLYYCEGLPISLLVNDTREGDSMAWYHRDILMPEANSGRYDIPACTLADGGWYLFSVNRNGCSGRDSLYVDVRVRPVPQVNDTFMCSGVTLVLDASNADYPGSTFLWYPGSIAGERFDINAGGSYRVVMRYKGCEKDSSFFVMERPSPNIEFPEELTICQRDSVLLSGPDSMELYRWQDGSSEKTYMVYAEGFYSLYVERQGCSDFREVFVQEDFCSNLYFPSAFTPNGDARNDRFGPITTALDEQVVYSLYIFNRNGEKVFESHSLQDSWDGTFKGEKCPVGLYVYRCEAHALKNGRNLSVQGTVNLLR